jgi:histidinol phosphatase-like enzyme
MIMFENYKAAFIDRDGVINEERNYVYRIEDFVLLPYVIVESGHAVDALARVVADLSAVDLLAAARALPHF